MRGIDDLGGSLGDDPLLLREHLLESLDERWKAYRKAVKRCRKRASEQGVHHLRVETRRLLSTLELLSYLSNTVQLRKAHQSLKKQLDAFDDLRDTHVQLLYTATMLRDFPELKRLVKRLERREKSLIKPAAHTAQRSKLKRLSRRISATKSHLKVAFAKTGVLHSTELARTVALPAAPAGRFRPAVRLAQAVQRAFNRVTELRHQIHPARLETIHRTRIAFKRFRYMIELLQPILPAVQPRQLISMDQYQTMMGEIQDISVMIERLDALLEKKKFKSLPLQRFRQVLLQRREMLVQGYLNVADQLFTFWPDNRVRRTRRPSQPVAAHAI
ncbi:MAG TPA: CHAD domain-containing protein [Verrucomicrobiae bacterium]|nr:CHAD domain-containing protein [Verrucomicrobiae bacterium]